ncbi:hypothetical protein CC80DRAFT_546295 [Byssothecium circinans]|uniref:Uncharacterized protein n=1 Tax=Byssothecium circinans TaxID=147558 RepID=A0A6A5U2T6_9PLEO|nr:hypothetical protein CC80DRAFT_546295 [Byssothecium circinans]
MARAKRFEVKMVRPRQVTNIPLTMRDRMNVKTLFHCRNKKTMRAFIETHAACISSLINDLDSLTGLQMAERAIMIRDEWKSKGKHVPLVRRLDRFRTAEEVIMSGGDWKKDPGDVWSGSHGLKMGISETPSTTNNAMDACIDPILLRASYSSFKRETIQTPKKIIQTTLLPTPPPSPTTDSTIIPLTHRLMSPRHPPTHAPSFPQPTIEATELLEVLARNAETGYPKTSYLPRTFFISFAHYDKHDFHIVQTTTHRRLVKSLKVHRLVSELTVYFFTGCGRKTAVGNTFERLCGELAKEVRRTVEWDRGVDGERESWDIVGSVFCP